MTRKVTRAVANILKGSQKELYLGNLNAQRDWGFAPEYVEMMWLMLQQETPDDYVVGTGESHTVKELVDSAFSYMGVQLEWKGEGAGTVGVVKSSGWEHLIPGAVLVRVDPRYFRPTEVEGLQADISKARRKLGWQPRVTFDELVKIMVDCDVRAVGLESSCQGIEASQGKGFAYTNHDFSAHEGIREH